MYMFIYAWAAGSPQLIYIVNCMPGFTFGLASWPSEKTYDSTRTDRRTDGRMEGQKFDSEKQQGGASDLNHGLEKLKPTTPTKVTKGPPRSHVVVFPTKPLR